MDADFWHKRWSSHNIGFHEDDINQFLVAYIDKQAIAEGSRCFIPLCGKTRDIHYLLSHGYHVVGAELSELAIEQLFDELSIEPNIRTTARAKHYSANGIDIFVGDIFDIGPGDIGPIDFVYDRAAFVALTDIQRPLYARLIGQITAAAPMLLVTFEYKQELMAGPPFSINKQEIQRCYTDIYDISMLASEPIKGGLKGVSTREAAWYLTQ